MTCLKQRQIFPRPQAQVADETGCVSVKCLFARSSRLFMFGYFLVPSIFPVLLFFFCFALFGCLLLLCFVASLKFPPSDSFYHLCRMKIPSSSVISLSFFLFLSFAFFK
ncbi:hypothetical protein, unlikely [Trypanosoma brucei gambiense DAL972]|uniref:Uncharacterized protein n=1 Tax=Trypanosoma brucei gambiense (strain MHOM/CI/86/DAL972) TaxID=679716 RepID=D0A071_TRYB9|nr:hypothetical protein, unlikely [Trypanosoma brucei gambiense DAL972]CBH16629.1 hypothetical protein, unlikely [Trypanosoma brucei gambiense DAL972]|eukprot:XP_011778893.1 hypothetical protein, unlikely [Trypanosoma brucei gambiense DAL972]